MDEFLSWFWKSKVGSFWSIRLIYTFANKSQSINAVCCTLLELSIRYFLHKASKLIEEPGNLSLAKEIVSIISFSILFFPIISNSLFKWAKSNPALWIINFFPSIKSKKSSTISLNFFCLAKKSSEYPWISKAFSETFLSGFK